MNAWGTERCEQKIDTIARWLKHSARIAGLPYVDLIARGLVSRAIRNSRRNATQVRVVTREHDQRWSVAITTAPRQDCTLKKCVESVRQCGWEPVIFAEPGSTSNGLTGDRDRLESTRLAQIPYGEPWLLFFVHPFYVNCSITHEQNRG